MKKYALLYIVCLILLSFASIASANSLNQSLLAYYTLDNVLTSNDTAAYDGTWGNAGTYEANCKVNGCFNFTAASSHYFASNSNYVFGANPSRTECAWVYSYDYSAYHGILGQPSFQMQLLTDASAQPLVRSYNPGENILTCTMTLPLNKWYYFCAVFTGGNAEIYINGTSVCSGANAVGADNSPIEVGRGYRGAFYYWKGLIDEVGLWNRAMNAANITALYNSHTGLSYPFTGGPPAATSPPTFTAPTPSDNAHNNTNVTFNCSHTSLDNLQFSIYKDDIALFINATPNGTNYLAWNSTLSDGNYNVSCQVHNVSNGLMSSLIHTHWTLDTTTPTITINSNNFFNASNLSSINQYISNITLNITFVDEADLFAVSINITKGGVVFFNYTNSSDINTLHLNYSKMIDTGSWGNGAYNIELCDADAHHYVGGADVGDYEIKKSMNKLTFDTAEGNEIIIASDGAISTGYIKSKKSFTFSFNYLFSSTSRTFYINSDNPISYEKNSSYKAHFVVWNGKQGNWVDFEGIEGKFTVRKNSPYEYQVDFYDMPSSKSTVTKSIGGLNVLCVDYSWYKGKAIDSYMTPATAGTSQTFALNLTKDAGYVPSTQASFTYNGTVRSTTKTSSTYSDLYQSTFNIPDIEAGYNLTWSINITQKDGKIYLFDMNGTQDVYLSQINITFYDEENLSFINDSFTVFLTSNKTSLTMVAVEGKLFAGNLTPGEYYIEAENANYPRRGVFFAVTNQSNNLNFYSVITATGNGYTDYYIIDSSQNKLDNVRMSFQRKYNSTYVTVAQGDTDFAGQFRLFQDQQNKYRIVMSKGGYPTKIIDLIPLLSSYTIPMALDAVDVYSNVYEGIRFTITPADTGFNISPNYQSIQFEVYDSSSSLEYFGMMLNNHSYSCIPASCSVNVSGSPSGGAATVQILLNESGRFQRHFYFKKVGWDVQYVNSGWCWADLIMIAQKGLLALSILAGLSLGTPMMRTIIATIGITGLSILAASFGVFGLPLVVVSTLGMAFFMIIGFIPRVMALILMIVGFAIFFVSSRNE